MSKKITIWLIILILVGVCVGWVGYKLVAYVPKTVQQLQTRITGLDKVTIAALALNSAHRYPGPDINTPTRAIDTQVFEGLVGLDKNLNLVPLLAKSWDNPDDLTWRFYLRKGVKFQNGDAFTAKDVKFTVDETNKKGFYGKRYLSNVAGVKIINDYTVELKTKKPDPVLVNKLSQVWIFNKNYRQKNGTILSIGTGPYKLESWDKDGKKVVLIRNDNYWGKLPKVKEVVWESFNRDADRLKAVDARKADIAYLVEGKEGIETGLKDKKVKTLVVPDYYVFFVGFDTQRDKTPYVYGVKNNPFKDLRVRKAIYEGINDKAVIQDALAGFGKERNEIVTKDIFGYDPNIRRYPYSVSAAKELLKEAGYPNGFKVNLDVGYYDLYIAKAIAKSLKNIGVIATPISRGGQAGTVPEDLTKFNNGDSSFYGFFINADVGDAIGALVNFFHTPDATNSSQRHFGVYNLGKYSNPELDNLIDKASVTMNRQERLQYMQEAISMIHKNVVVVPLFSAALGFALNPDKHLLFTPRPDSEIRARSLAKKETKIIPVQEKKSFWQIVFGL